MTRSSKRKVFLEERQQVADGAGGFSGSWQLLGTHWAEVLPRSGRLEAGEGNARSRARYILRIRAVAPEQPSRPRPGQRFREGSRIFAIRAVTEARGTRLYLDCLVDEETVL